MVSVSPVLITSSPPVAGQQQASAVTSSKSRYQSTWPCSSSPTSDLLPSPSTIFPTPGTTIKSNYWARHLTPASGSEFRSAKSIFEQQNAPSTQQNGSVESTKGKAKEVEGGEGFEERPEVLNQLAGVKGPDTCNSLAIEDEVEAVPKDKNDGSVLPTAQSFSERLLDDTVFPSPLRIKTVDDGNERMQSVAAANSAPIPPKDEDELTAVGVPATKCARKRKVEPSTSKKQPPKITRKRLRKSDTIIINSDEPEDLTVGNGRAVAVSAVAPSGWSALISREDSARSPSKQISSDSSGGQAHHAEAHTPETPYSAMRRRRSWTPAKETLPVTAPLSASMAEREARVGAESQTPQTSLAAAIKRFNHDSENNVGEDDQKVSHPVGRAAPSRSKNTKTKVEESVSKPAKKHNTVRKSREKKVKGPKTITALATLAYQPQAPPVTLPINPVEAVVPIETVGAETSHSAGPQKVKRTAKPRAKSSDQVRKPKKTATSKKPGSKASLKASNATPLLPPAEARSHELKQIFLFGTSSQLAVDESPAFVQELQQAIRDSEVAIAADAGVWPQQKSRANVPTAPHGTLLSVGQTDRDLWCNAARDSGGHLTRPEGNSNTDIPSKICEPTRQVNALGPHDGPQPVDETIQQGGTGEIVDLCRSSPLPGPAAQSINADQDYDKTGTPAKIRVEEIPDAVDSDGTEFSDSWMMLRSEESEDKESDKYRPLKTITSPIPSVAARPILDMLGRSSKARVALQVLDVNISPSGNVSPFKTASMQRREMTSTATKAVFRDVSPTRARARASPKATSLARNTKQTSPKKADSLDNNKASAPAAQDLPSSGYKDIDEIYDSDVPPTPSPPRRKTAASPIQSLPLDLRPDGEGASVSPTRKTAVIKPGDGNWPAIQKQIFPKISAAVTSAPRSDDIKKPSWHEKILLYDPIVLEDLTSWLNEKGVRYESCRVKAKPKARGRKKANAVEAGPEYETSLEPLKPWMVQKWCEEKSICCLWKEGLRGGVRTRY